MERPHGWDTPLPPCLPVVFVAIPPLVIVVLAMLRDR